MVIRELITKFGFDVDHKKLDEMEKGVDQLKMGLIGLTSLVVTTSVALFGMVKVSANAAASIIDTASAVGVTTDALQELGYAAMLNGASVDSMSASLRFLSLNIARAGKEPTSDLAKTFRSLGVDVTDANGKLLTADKVFYNLADSFRKIQDPARKVEVATDLLGKSGTKLIQVLDQGSKGVRSFNEELRASGGFLGESELKRLADFNNGWDRLFSLLGGIRNAIASELAPVLIDMMDAFRKWIAANGTLIKQRLVEVFKAFAWYLKIIYTVGIRVADMFMSMAKNVGGVAFVMKGLLILLTALSAIGTIAGLMAISTAFIAIGKAIIIGMAPFALVAAKVVALGALIFLIAEDIYTFFTGGNSVTGIIVDSVIDAVIWIRQIFSDFFDWFEGKLKGWANGFAAWFQELIAPFVAMMNKMSGGFRSFLKPIDDINRSLFSTGSVSGITPTTRPAGGGVNSSNQNVSVSAPISVVVPPGTDPARVPDSIESGLRAGVWDVFRVTERATTPGMR